MLIDFANEFSEFLVPWTGSRPTAGADNAEGVYVPGASVPLSFQAVPVQPLTMKELQMVEGGEFVRSIVKTYTPFALEINDIVSYLGENYEIHQIDQRDPLGTYRKVYLVKVQNDH